MVDSRDFKTLDQLAIKHGTDKSSLHHNYCKIYEKYFAPLRLQPIVLIEAGIGGYEHFDRGGESARMWREYFPNAGIDVFDIYDKKQIDGASVCKGSQSDEIFLKQLFFEAGEVDIYIDDGAHRNDLSIRNFEIVFPLLKSGGIYVIEDTEMAWYDSPDFLGTQNFTDREFPHVINFIRGLMNDVNAQYIAHYKQTYEIESIHVYKNICFIIKK